MNNSLARQQVIEYIGGASNPLHNYRDYSSNDYYYSCWTSNSTSYYSET